MCVKKTPLHFQLQMEDAQPGAGIIVSTHAHVKPRQGEDVSTIQPTNFAKLDSSVKMTCLRWMSVVEQIVITVRLASSVTTIKWS